MVITYSIPTRLGIQLFFLQSKCTRTRAGIINLGTSLYSKFKSEIQSAPTDRIADLSPPTHVSQTLFAAKNRCTKTKKLTQTGRPWQEHNKNESFLEPILTALPAIGITINELAQLIMSVEKLNTFMKKVKNDSDLKERLMSAKSSEEVRSIALEYGHEFPKGTTIVKDLLSDGCLMGLSGGVIHSDSLGKVFIGLSGVSSTTE